MRRPTRLVFAAALLVAGCASEAHTQEGTVSPMPDRPTITKAQALERIQELINGTVGAVDPQPTLKLYEPSLRDAPCDQPTDGGSKDRIVVYREYYLNGIPKDRLKSVA